MILSWNRKLNFQTWKMKYSTGLSAPSGGFSIHRKLFWMCSRRVTWNEYCIWITEKREKKSTHRRNNNKCKRMKHCQVYFVLSIAREQHGIPFLLAMLPEQNIMNLILYLCGIFLICLAELLTINFRHTKGEEALHVFAIMLNIRWPLFTNSFWVLYCDRRKARKR